VVLTLILTCKTPAKPLKNADLSLIIVADLQRDLPACKHHV